MAYSYQDMVSDGSTTQVQVAINFIDRSHLSVLVNGVLAAYTWLSPSANTIVLGAAPAAGSVIRIKRTTPRDKIKYDYSKGSQFSTATVDANNLQLLYIDQEIQDELVAVYGSVSVANLYLGPSATPPTSTASGLPIADGMLYYNTADSLIYVKTPGGWRRLTPTSAIQVSNTIAAAGQVVFSTPATFLPGTNTVEVWVNGAHVNVGADYTEASDGNSVILTAAAASGDDVTIRVLQTLAVGSTASSLVTYGNSTVKDALDAINLQDYAALRAYTGSAKSVYITGYLVYASPSGIAGDFVRDDTDTTTPSNGGTVIVDDLGRRWKRRYSGSISAMWFGAVGDGVTDDLAAFNAALAAVGNNQVIHMAPSKTYRLSGPWVFPNTKRFITVEGNGSTIFASHNGDGIVLTSLNEGYGGHVLHNLTIRGPNVAYPFSAAELAGTSNGAAVRLGGDNTNSPSAYGNVFHNCYFLQFKHGVYMQAALFCNFFGGAIKYNQYGVTVDGGQTNANNFHGVLIRENRVRGLYSTGNSAGALTKATCNVFYGGGFESNVPFRGDNPPGYSNGYPINMDYTGVGVAVFLSDSYDFVFDGTYFENHNYSVWVNGSSDNNSFTHCRFAPSGNRIGGVLLDNVGTSFNTFSRCTMVSADTTTPNVETFNANQFNNQFLDCEGFTFIDANLVSKPYVRNNRANQAGGGTPIGAIIMPPHGYISNLGEGASSGTITGIGTASATLNVGGYGEIEFGNLITADTTITAISGMSKGQHLTIRNYQTAHKVKIISSTDDTGLILLKNKRSVTMNKYGQELHLYCNSQGKVYEVGRNFSDNVSGFAQISGTDTSVDVVFDNPEPDTNYVTFVTANESSGTPANGAWIVRSSAQTVNGFRITVQAAPGTGNSFVYNWQAVR